MDVMKMSLKIKKIKTSKPNKLGRLPQKKDYKKIGIINISDHLKINHNTTSISNQFNKTMINEIGYQKSNGLMYSNIMKFR